MEPQYWQKKWNENQIGFHQSDVNKRLVEYWPKVTEAASFSAHCIFVPLCGKSLDMLWLHAQGHQVLGIELSEKAAKAFFEENQLPFNIVSEGEFQRFSGIDSAKGLAILVGDFFALTPEQTACCTAVYDRASMIAMNPDMRADYAGQLARVTPAGSIGLLLLIEYDQTRMQGPPFSVSDAHARELLLTNFDINELAHYQGPERLGNLAKRGLETLHERVYLLTRKS